MKRAPFGQTSACFRTDRQAKELPDRSRLYRVLVCVCCSVRLGEGVERGNKDNVSTPQKVHVDTHICTHLRIHA